MAKGNRRGGGRLIGARTASGLGRQRRGIRTQGGFTAAVANVRRNIRRRRPRARNR